MSKAKTKKPKEDPLVDYFYVPVGIYPMTILRMMAGGKPIWVLPAKEYNRRFPEKKIKRAPP